MYREGERRKIFYRDEISESCFQNIGNRIKPLPKAISSFHPVHERDNGETPQG